VSLTSYAARSTTFPLSSVATATEPRWSVTKYRTAVVAPENLSATMSSRHVVLPPLAAAGPSQLDVLANSGTANAAEDIVMCVSDIQAIRPKIKPNILWRI